MKCSQVVFAVISVQYRHSLAVTAFAIGDHHCLDDGKNDGLGGAEEVGDVQGAVLNFDLEVVDLGQECVDGLRVASCLERVDNGIDEILQLSESLTVNHDITRRNRRDIDLAVDIISVVSRRGDVIEDMGGKFGGEIDRTPSDDGYVRAPVAGSIVDHGRFHQTSHVNVKTFRDRAGIDSEGRPPLCSRQELGWPNPVKWLPRVGGSLTRAEVHGVGQDGSSVDESEESEEKDSGFGKHFEEGQIRLR